MMRRLAVLPLALAVLCVQAASVLASGVADTGPGCGLGKVAWEDSKNTNSIGAQLLISTTNNTILPWQAFGITSGTLGCKNNGKVWAEQKMKAFASINFENLTQEMAQGQGEHLASLATLMNVPAEHQAEFFAMAQDKYTTLIQSGETTPVAMLNALHDAMAAHPVLVKVATSR